MSMKLVSALRLNNRGVELLLQEDQDQQALSTLTQALDQVKVVLAASPDDEDPEGYRPSRMFIHDSTLA